MSGCVLTEKKLCGCCDGVEQQTPQAIANRPALSSIAYRAGTYPTFFASMLASLSDPALPALSLLRTRDRSDLTIALLDAWAVTLDVLTFYQERFANEAFIRTAIERRSVFDLARLVGYIPSPGVAASAVLAFTLADAVGSPDNVLIAQGTRVQSIPGPGEKPQVFETSADLTASIAYNAMPAQTTVAWTISTGDKDTWIAGTANHLNPGDALLFVAAVDGVPISTGPGDVHYLTEVVLDPSSGNTHIFWDQPLSSAFGTLATAQQVTLYVFRKKAALYGVQAPSPLTLATTNTNVSKIPGYPTSGSDWNFIYTENSDQINLDAAYPGLAPQVNGPPQWTILTGLGYTSFFQIKNAVESNPGYYTLTTKTTQLTLAKGQILTGNTSLSLNSVLWEFVQETRNITAYVQSAQLTPADLPITTWLDASAVPLATGMVVPVQGSTFSISGGQQIAVNQPIGISGKRVRLEVIAGALAIFFPANSSGTLPVADAQVFLVNSFPPVVDPATSTPAWSVQTLSGIPGSLVLFPNNLHLLPADPKNDSAISEAAVISAISVAGGVTTISVKPALTGIYDATTVTVNANAVQATNGETVHEILGSGDATKSALQFTLKQQPLTQTSAATATGTQSTLQVWVNNLQWHEIDNLLASGPKDRVFVTRVDPQGKVIVEFGNGIQGARPPTGQSNIRAVYRKGIGSAGMVKAGQLSQPLDRPQGLQSAINPSAASGAADPATPDDARRSAPLPTLTIGRVVSLEDYENYARAFAGVAKVVATWTWFGSLRGVFLSVAGAAGAVLAIDDPVIVKLVAALQQHGNPYVPIRVAPYVPVLFRFTAAVLVDRANYDTQQVLAQVWQNLSTAFSFQQRQLAQNVAAGEIIEIIQQTVGVTAVQLQALTLTGESPSAQVPARLCAAGPTPPDGAQMLLLDPQTQAQIGVWS